MILSFLKQRKPERFFLFLIIVASLLAAIPLLRGDFFHFSDEPHIANLYQMIRAISSGQIPPRWAPDVSYEFGHPLFNFYYPLPFYLGSLFYFLGGSLIVSLKLVFLLTIPLSGVFMYFWLKKHTDNWGALAGSVIYLFTPYRAVDLYVRGAVGEALAFVFFPLLLLSIYRVFEKKGAKEIGILGIVTGLFFLSHNLAPILFLPFAAFYSFVLAFNLRSFKDLLKVALGALLGFGTSVYFTLPAFLERGLLKSVTPFNYLDHFPFVKQLIFSPFRYGASLPGPNDDLSFQVGIVNWILLFLGIVFIKKTLKKKKLLFILFSGSFLIGLFLMNIRSSFLWEAFSLATYIQFPWRLLMVTTFLTSSFVIFLNPERLKRKIFFGFLALLAVVLNFSYFRPSEYFSPDDSYFLKRFFARTSGEKETSKEYLSYSEDYLLLPIWTEERPKSLPMSKFTSKDLNIREVKEVSRVDFVAKVEGEGILEFNSYYFPGWTALVDGKEANTKPLKPYGNIGIEIKDGEKEVRVLWQETALRKAFDVVSLVSFLSLFAFILLNNKIGRRT